MLRNKLVRSDGTIIDSSVIISCEFTEEVNSAENLAVGDVTASEVSVEMLATVMMESDEVLTYYIIEDDVETLIGKFIVDKPSMVSRNTLKFSAYDNITKTEKDFSDWLRNNQNKFPMPLASLVTEACQYCGVEMSSTTFPHSTIAINAFYADGITCRQILSWAAAMAGRFVRANAAGKISFDWYADGAYMISPNPDGDIIPATVTSDGDGNVSITSDYATVRDAGSGNVVVDFPTVAVMANEGAVTLGVDEFVAYKSNGLSHEGYTTDTIKRVQIKQSDDDIGVIYPSTATGNCFTISENMLLGACSTDDVLTVAADLYNQLCTISYVPSKVSLMRSCKIRAGTIADILDTKGNTFRTYVMKMSISPSGTEIESRGAQSYESNVAVASEKYKNLAGKILSLSKTVDGLQIKNEDLAGKVASLELSTEGFKTSVSDTYVTSDAFGEYQKTIKTSFEETSKSFDFKFDESTKSIDKVSGDLAADQEERMAYIRFEDGNIILGRTESDILLIIKNNRISFVRNVKDQPELAWFANDVLHVNDGEFVSNMTIGKFAFTPGTNGNLSFKKVVK